MSLESLVQGGAGSYQSGREAAVCSDLLAELRHGGRPAHTWLVTLSEARLPAAGGEGAGLSAQEQLWAPSRCVVLESGGDVCRALTKIPAQMATKNSTNPKRTSKTRRCLTLGCLFALWGAVLLGQVCAHLSRAGEGRSPGGGCHTGLDGDPRWASWGVGAGGGLSSGGGG